MRGEAMSEIDLKKDLRTVALAQLCVSSQPNKAGDFDRTCWCGIIRRALNMV